MAKKKTPQKTKNEQEGAKRSSKQKNKDVSPKPAKTPGREGRKSAPPKKPAPQKKGSPRRAGGKKNTAPKPRRFTRLVDASTREQNQRNLDRFLLGIAAVVLILSLATVAFALNSSAALRTVDGEVRDLAPQLAIEQAEPAEQPAADPAVSEPAAAATVDEALLPESSIDDFSGTVYGQAADFASAPAYENGTLIGGDRFTFNRFERPFSSRTSAYYADLDIVSLSVLMDQEWVVGRIRLEELPDSSEKDRFAMELDVDRDNRGDFLIITTLPASTEWSTATVRVYEDRNNDVGGVLPGVTDESAVRGDGFETQISNDFAAARLSPTRPETVEISFPRSLLPSPGQFLVSFWAGRELLEPSTAYLNDWFTQAEAGATDPSMSYYRVKAVAEIDNTCRIAVGFAPAGTEVNLCTPPG